MRWWRLGKFLTLWWHFFASGESKWGKASKLIGLLFFLFAIPATLWRIPFVFCLQLEGGCLPWSIRLGLLVAIAVGIGWLLLTAGRAYENSGVPELIVGKELAYDGVRYRLALMSKEKDLDTKVRLMGIVDANNDPLVPPARFPLELEWSHHPEKSAIHLTAGIADSVSVANIHVTKSGLVSLVFTGAQHQGHIALESNQGAYFHLLIEYPKRKLIERWFRFEEVGDDPPAFNVTADRPTLMPL
jgi:hypothetical protein